MVAQNQNFGNNDPPWKLAKAQQSQNRLTPSLYNQVQSQLEQYMMYDMPAPATDKFPEIMGFNRHAVLTQWFHRAPFGQPRGVDLITLRKLAESSFVTMCLNTRIDQVTALPWGIVPEDPDNANDKNIEDAYEFMKHPNQNQESLPHVIRGYLDDILTLDAGALVKTFSGDMQERKYSVPEPLQDHWGTTLSKVQPRDYILKRNNRGRLKKEVPQGGARLEEFFSRDGGSFVKDVDQYGLIYGYWQYTYKYPAPAPIPFSDREIVYGMMHPRTWGPYGFSPIQSLQRIIGILITQTIHSEKYYEEGGVPPGILALMNMSVDQFNVWKAYFYDEIAGSPHKIPMINPGAGGDAKWIPFSFTNKDIQFLETQMWWLKLVCGVMKVNFNELGITDSVNRATSEEQSQIFKRSSLRPLIDLVEWVINLEIMNELHAQGMEGTLFKFQPEIDSFEKARRTTIFTSEATIGLRTINEIRREDYNLDPVEWGEVPEWWFKQQNPMINPFQDFGNGGNGDGELPENPEDVREQEPRKEDEDKKADKEPDDPELKNAIKEAFLELYPQIGGFVSKDALAYVGRDIPHPAPNPNPPLLDLSKMPVESRQKFIEDLQELFKQAEPVPEDEEPKVLDSFYGLPNPSNIAEEDPRAISPEPLEQEFNTALKALFASQEEEVLKALGVYVKGMGLEKARAALDALGGKHFKQLLNVVQRFIMRALHRGGNKAFKELKVEGAFDLRDEDAERFMQDFSALLAKSKFIQIRERVRMILVSGLEKGESVYIISENLRKAFGSMKKTEARRIARTEIARAMNRGREIGYQRSSMIIAKEWLVTWDDRLCEVCRPMSRQIVPLGADFLAQTGARVKTPPLHPNCRCTILPVLREDALKSTTGQHYTLSKKMEKVVEFYGKPLDEILPELLEQEKSLNKVAERISKEVEKTTTQTLSNWAKLLDIETLPPRGDTTAFRNKTSSE